ncbi:SRPBCC family protein [Phenylobacterium hankyongense]|nr:SRPBCC family protein [Phenylobacterium hankyongense]
MGNRVIAGVAGAMLLVAAGSASAQPAAPPPPTAPFAIPNPTYATMVLEVAVARPAEAVWRRVGKFCDIGEWMRTSCAITSGSDSQLGAVRKLGLGVTEMLVGKTDRSYTYAQPVRAGVPYNAYHGTLEVKPVTASTSKLVYSFFYDTSMLADDAARATESANRRARFTQALQNMKVLAEGGTLPPAP